MEVKCTLDSGGNVTAAQVLLGPLELGEPVRQNALQWMFKRTSNEVSGNFTTLKYVFLLEGKPQDRSNATFVFELPNEV